MTTRPIFYSQVSFLTQLSLGVVVLTAYTNRLKKIMQKFFFISIHKPPASIIFAPIRPALAVTAEPFMSSSRQVGVAYELSHSDFDVISGHEDGTFTILTPCPASVAQPVALRDEVAAGDVRLETFFRHPWTSMLKIHLHEDRDCVVLIQVFSILVGFHTVIGVWIYLVEPNGSIQRMCRL